jgi:hypothetical protein
MKKSYSVKISDCSTYIYVDVNDIVTPEIAQNFTTESHQLGFDNKIFTFIMDFRGARNMAPPKNNADFAKNRPKTIIEDFKLNLHFIIDKVDKSHDFVILLFRNRGLKLHVHHDLEPALKAINKAALKTTI